MTSSIIAETACDQQGCIVLHNVSLAKGPSVNFTIRRFKQ